MHIATFNGHDPNHFRPLRYSWLDNIYTSKAKLAETLPVDGQKSNKPCFDAHIFSSPQRIR